MLNLKKLYINAMLINIFFHFQRNNPRTTVYLHNRMISEIGFENWGKIHPSIRNEWDLSRNSFDRMFGLIKAWYISGADITAEYSKPQPSEAEKMGEQIRILKAETELMNTEIEKQRTEKKLSSPDSRETYTEEDIKRTMENVLNEFCEKSDSTCIVYKRGGKK